MQIRFTAPALVNAATRRNGSIAPVVCGIPVTVDIPEIPVSGAAHAASFGIMHHYMHMGGRFYGASGRASHVAEGDPCRAAAITGMDRAMLARVADVLFDWDALEWRGDIGDHPSSVRKLLQQSRLEELSRGFGINPLIVGMPPFGGPPYPHLDGLFHASSADVDYWASEATEWAKGLFVCGDTILGPVAEPVVGLTIPRNPGGESHCTALPDSVAAFEGRKLPPTPYGKFKPQAFGHLVGYWVPFLDYFDMTDTDGVRACVEAELAASGLHGSDAATYRARVDEAMAGIKIGDGSLFGSSSADRALDRTARVAVSALVDCLGGKGATILSRKAPRDLSDAVADLFETTRDYDLVDGVPDDVETCLERLHGVLISAASELDAAEIIGLDHRLMSRQIERSITKWQARPLEIADRAYAPPAHPGTNP